MAYEPNSDKGTWTLLSTQTASTSATIDFTGLDGTYKKYVVEGISIVPETDDVDLYMQVSTDNGSNWITTNTYYWDYDGENQGGGASGSGDGVAQIVIYDAIGSGTGEYIDFSMSTKDLANASRYKAFVFNDVTFKNKDGNAGRLAHSEGHYLANTAVNAVKFYMSADAILSGTFKLYGIK